MSDLSRSDESFRCVVAERGGSVCATVCIRLLHGGEHCSDEAARLGASPKPPVGADHKTNRMRDWPRAPQTSLRGRTDA